MKTALFLNQHGVHSAHIHPRYSHNMLYIYIYSPSQVSPMDERKKVKSSLGASEYIAQMYGLCGRHKDY